MRNRREYDVNDILYFYGERIDDLVSDNVCKNKNEAANLIKDILSCGVGVDDRGLVMELFLKVKEIKSRNKTIIEKDMSKLRKANNIEIINALLDRINPDRHNDYLEEYSEEYIYDNDDKYYIPKVKRRILEKETK